MERAMEIALKHLQQANPSMWNGQNERPADFDSRIGTYPIDKDTELDISFEYEKEDGWLHLCELRGRKTGELLNIMHGYPQLISKLRIGIPKATKPSL